MKLYQPPGLGSPMLRENTVPIFVIDDRDSLQGPLTGIVQLPLELDWSGGGATTWEAVKPY